jgi:hypothetical protein
MKSTRPLAPAALRLALVAAALAGPATPGLADPFSPEQSTATLTVTYRLAGGGEDLPASHERHVIWSVENSYKVKATLIAQKPSGAGGLHQPDANETAQNAERQAAAQSAAGNMQDMMAQAQQIMDKCGDDEACVQTETMKMAQGIDPNSPQLQQAKKDIDKASQMPDLRYQMFNGGQQSGTYQVAEKAHEAYFDAACSLKNEPTCAIDTAVVGNGALDDGNGNKTFQTGTMAEVDTQTGSLVFILPPPGIAAAKRTVKSPNPDAKTGTFDEMRQIHSEVAGERIEVSCGACRSASGKITRDVEDQLLRRPAKLTIEWTFTRP